ncbi:MAG: signal recognition particle-docking protein FtsY [candidate division WOR-3 bacterium]
MGLFERLKQGLEKTRQLLQGLRSARNIDEIERLLLMADVGVRATDLLLERVRQSGAEPVSAVRAEMERILRSTAGSAGFPAAWAARPQVVMVVGINGSGKTTTVGKLCHYLIRRGQKVVVAAADTYRDAAARQLGIWAERAGALLVMSQPGQDAAAVAFDAIQKARSAGSDVVLVDTAGRMHTRQDLMQEAVKIRRVCAKALAGTATPPEVWLVLDATVGQNGIRQAQVFNAALGLTGIIVTKLDGTAKGGVLIPIVLELGLPVRFVGTGEGIDDLDEFDAETFVRALLED